MAATPIEAPPLTGQALVDSWRDVCKRRGWIVDQGLPPFLFHLLIEMADRSLLDAASRKPRTLPRG